jgi:hypothetical protein
VKKKRRKMKKKKKRAKKAKKRMEGFVRPTHHKKKGRKK